MWLYIDYNHRRELQDTITFDFESDGIKLDSEGSINCETKGFH